MSETDTFFVSEAIEDLFGSNVGNNTVVHINDRWKGTFISFCSKNRTVKFDIEANNPFNIVSTPELDIVIEFSSGASRKIPYTSFSYRIEQKPNRYIITVEDKTS